MSWWVGLGDPQVYTTDKDFIITIIYFLGQYIRLTGFHIF